MCAGDSRTQSDCRLPRWLRGALLTIGFPICRLTKPCRCCFGWPLMENKSPDGWMQVTISAPHRVVTVTAFLQTSRAQVFRWRAGSTFLALTRGPKTRYARFWSRKDELV